MSKSKRYAPNVIRQDAVSPGGQRVDAEAQGIIWEKNLTLVEAEVTKKEYPENKMRTALPVDTTGGPGVTHREWKVLDRVGAWAMLAGYAGDLPLIGVTGELRSARCFPFGAAYGWSQADADAMLYAGATLDSDLAVASRDTYEELFESVNFNGHAKAGLTGLNNHPNIPLITGGGAWTGRTADEIIADFVNAFSFITKTSKGKENASLCMLPISRFEIARTKRIGTDTKDTVLDFVKSLYPNCVFTSYHALETADAAGTGPRMILASQDKSRGYFWEPSGYRAHPMERQLLKYLVAVDAKLGGFICKRPLGFAYVDNI